MTEQPEPEAPQAATTQDVRWKLRDQFTAVSLQVPPALTRDAETMCKLAAVLVVLRPPKAKRTPAEAIRMILNEATGPGITVLDLESPEMLALVLGYAAPLPGALGQGGHRYVIWVRPLEPEALRRGAGFHADTYDGQWSVLTLVLSEHDGRICFEVDAVSERAQPPLPASSAPA